jgi:excisionase family DNA binding protein
MTKDDDFPAIPGYVPIKEAAKLLGISNPRMYGYVREKRIPARKAGRTLMIPLEELEHFKLNPPVDVFAQKQLIGVYTTVVANSSAWIFMYRFFLASKGGL